MPPIDDIFVVDMTPCSTERFDLPGSDGEFFVVATQFNTSGNALYNASLVEGDGSASVAVLLAGIIDFALPGKLKDGTAVTLKHATFHSDCKVFQQLIKSPATLTFLLSAVGKLNPSIYRELTEEEQAEAAADLRDKQSELAELREIEGEEAPLDPSGCAGPPAACTEEAAATAPASCTPSSAPK